MSNPVKNAHSILLKLLEDDVIQVRPSDRERFMTEWRQAMGELHNAEGMIDVTYFDVDEKLPELGMDDDDHGQIWGYYPAGVELVAITDFLEDVKNPEKKPISWARTGLIQARF